MPSGRKPGYTHNKKTKSKMSQSHTGLDQDESTKSKISKALRGRSKSEEHRESLSRSLYDLDRKCLHRFLEMRSEYPGHEEFFDSNRTELLHAMRDLKSEKELRDIRRYVETVHLENVPQACIQYQYDSSSMYAHEETMVELIDASRFLRKELNDVYRVLH